MLDFCVLCFVTFVPRSITGRYPPSMLFRVWNQLVSSGCWNMSRSRPSPRVSAPNVIRLRHCFHCHATQPAQRPRPPCCPQSAVKFVKLDTELVSLHSIQVLIAVVWNMCVHI